MEIGKAAPGDELVHQVREVDEGRRKSDCLNGLLINKQINEKIRGNPCSSVERRLNLKRSGRAGAGGLENVGGFLFGDRDEGVQNGGIELGSTAADEAGGRLPWGRPADDSSGWRP